MAIPSMLLISVSAILRATHEEVSIVVLQVAKHLAAGAAAVKAVLIMAPLLPNIVADVQRKVTLCELLPSGQVMQRLEVYLQMIMVKSK
jgi:hypothetical protein